VGATPAPWIYHVTAALVHQHDATLPMWRGRSVTGMPHLKAT